MATGATRRNLYLDQLNCWTLGFAMTSDPDIPDAVTPERLVAELRPLLPLAHVLARLQNLLSNPNSGLDDIAELIRLDAAMATRIIQISNSVWYRRGLPCMSISEAINRVGFREIYKVVGVVASDSLVAQPLTAYGRTAVAAWRESVACAFAAELLAEQLGEDMAEAYMCGLLHLIGRLPINQFLQSPGAPARTLTEAGFPHEHSGAEFALLGFTQANVGTIMATKLGFPPTVCLPIFHQYAPQEAGEPHDRAAAMLYCARLLAALANEKLTEGDVVLDEEILGILRLSQEEVLAHLPELKTQIERAQLLAKV